MGVPKSVQMRALAYLLEQGVDDKPKISAAEAQLRDDALLWEFLHEVHPAGVDGLMSQSPALVRDLYKDEFESWRMARRLANMDEQERFLWNIAMDTLPGKQVD